MCVSMGTCQNSVMEIYYKIAEACHALDTPVQLVLALGKKGATLDIDRIAKLQSNTCSIIVADCAPQVVIFAKTSLLITHARQNTALEGVMAGLPMLAIPIANDQPGVAARLVHAGVAKLILPTKPNDVPAVKQAIQELLTDPKYRQASRELK